MRYVRRIVGQSAPVRSALSWQGLRPSGGAAVEQAAARNNSWYLIVPEGSGLFVLRYASQSGNTVIGRELTAGAAKAEAERHADRYDTRV